MTINVSNLYWTNIFSTLNLSVSNNILCNCRYIADIKKIGFVTHPRDLIDYMSSFQRSACDEKILRVTTYNLLRCHREVHYFIHFEVTGRERNVIR